MRIGIFGGTFDPPHKGHLALAQAAWKELKLGRLYIVPAKISPFKKRSPVARAAARVRLLRFVVRRQKGWKISRIEMNRRGGSYSYQTVKAFSRRERGSELFLIMGDDGLLHFNLWKNWREILKLAKIAAGKRSGRKISPRFLKGYDSRVVRLKSKMPGISSSEIRVSLSKGSPDSKKLPAPVAQYL